MNGQKEKRSGQQILADLLVTWQKDTPYTLKDVDGQEFKVIITDFKGRQPIQHQNRKRREYVIPVELLEV